MVAAIALGAPGCQRDGEAAGPRDGGSSLTADSPEFAAISRVLATHADGLMAIPGVVGVAVGLSDDGATPSLQVLVERSTPELTARLPDTLEGHPVVVVESGEIRPLDER